MKGFTLLELLIVWIIIGAFALYIVSTGGIEPLLNLLFKGVL